MISRVGSSAVQTAYTNSVGDSKEMQGVSTNSIKQGDTSKIEQIKEALASGEYKINLQALSEKIAEELM